MLLLHRCSTLDHLRQAHALLLKSALHRRPFLLAKFLRRCFSLLSPEALPYGLSLFHRHPNPDGFLCNTAIAAHLRAGRPAESLRLFRRMQRLAVPVDSFGVSLSVQGAAASRDARAGGALHGQAAKRGFSADVFVQTALVEMYARAGGISMARQVFDEMPLRDMVAHNVMLGEYVSCGEIPAARKLFEEMPCRDLVSWNTMIHGLAVSGDLAGAREIFERSGERDVVSWSSMISGYARRRLPGEALKLFREMQVAGVSPDKVTMASLLSAAGDLGALATGRMIHDYVNKNRMEIDVKLGTSLLDMYAKCGDIESSLVVFERMKEKDVFAWSAMIAGLANHGRAESALELFSEMLSQGVEPNGSTFVGVLSACNHAGLVSRGRAYFNSMAGAHGIVPTIEHYGCLVDLLGRAGHLQEAREVIMAMPVEPDAVLWRALLGGCRVHKNLELAREAALELVKMEPRVEGHYVLFCNVLAQASRWDGVAGVRRTMRESGIRKVPGSSSVEVDGVVHAFIAGDRSHPRSEEIYAVLDEMSWSTGKKLTGDVTGAVEDDNLVCWSNESDLAS